MKEIEKARRIISLLEKADKRSVLLNCIGQILLSVFDLVGIAIVGLIGALSVAGVSSQEPGTRTSTVLNLLKLEELTFQMQVGFLAVLATALLVLKTVFSVILQRKNLSLISSISSRISTSLFSKVLEMNYQDILKHKNQEYVYSIAGGVNFLILAVLGAGSTFIADLALLLILTALILAVNPVLAAITVLYFVVIGLVLYLILHSRAHRLGVRDASQSNLVASKIYEALNAYREIHVRDKRQSYVDFVKEIQTDRAEIYADKAFMPHVSKYVLEISLIVGALGISAAQFLLLDARHAIATLALFLAAGSRIAPAILRLQQGLIQFRSQIGSGEITFDLMMELEKKPSPFQEDVRLKLPREFSPLLEIDNLEYKSSDGNFSLGPLNLTISPFSHVAVIGKSGSGKSTFADLIMGINLPTSGSISLSSIRPGLAVKVWPGKVGYVPQEVSIIDGTIKENITLGFNPDDFLDKDVQEAANKASLQDLISNTPEGIHHQVGERGSRLSGGQRQRIGIARALLTNPKFLILDEATSALDPQTEDEINELMKRISKDITILVIAHRIQTLRESKRVLYFENGKIIADGTFAEIKELIPDFDPDGVLGPQE